VKLEVAKIILQCPDDWSCEIFFVLGCPEVIFKNGQKRIVHIFGSSGNLSRIIYADHSGYHRNPNEGPALIYYSDSGKIIGEEYYSNGWLHRDPLEGPAITNYFKNGNIKSEHYYVHGARVRPPN